MAIRYALDWRRLTRWCLLGTVIMLVWSIAPVVKCSVKAFQATPVSEAEELTPSQIDANRVEQSRGFLDKVTTAASVCYEQTPLLGQEPWKRDLLLGFAGAALLFFCLSRWDASRRKTFEG